MAEACTARVCGSLTVTDVDDQEGDLCVVREEFLLDAGEVCAGHGASVQAEGADCGDEVACLQVSAQAQRRGVASSSVV